MTLESVTSRIKHRLRSHTSPKGKRTRAPSEQPDPEAPVCDGIPGSSRSVLPKKPPQPAPTTFLREGLRADPQPKQQSAAGTPPPKAPPPAALPVRNAWFRTTCHVFATARRGHYASVAASADGCNNPNCRGDSHKAQGARRWATCLFLAD